MMTCKLGLTAGAVKALNDGELGTATKQSMVSEKQDHSRRSLPKSPLVFAQHGGATDEVNISGNQVLGAVLVAFCLMGTLVWALVRYWLFAP